MYIAGVPGRLPRDPKEGIEWLRKAAEQGNAEAQHNPPLALAQSATQASSPPI
jgi:TPR repeat protein